MILNDINNMKETIIKHKKLLGSSTLVCLYYFYLIFVKDYIDNTFNSTSLNCTTSI